MIDVLIDVLAIAAMAAWLAVAAVACIGVLYNSRDRPALTPEETSGPFAALIIPVRGVPPQLDALWQGICSQTYRPFRVIFAVESESDPACQALRALAGGPAVEIVVAGATTQRAQKVHNLLAALRTLRPDDLLVAFADADIAPDVHWLARLVRVLDKGGANVVSGYRWMIPTDDRWATAFTCVINASIATAPKRSEWGQAWGGSILLHRRTLDVLDIEAVWGHAALDDVPLARAVKRSGLLMRTPRDALVLSPVSYGWREAIAFGRRQYLFVRLHAPAQWLIGAGATTLPLIGWAVALPLALSGDILALAVIAAANALDQVRASARSRVPRKLWGMELPPRVACLDRFATPAWLAVHAAIIWSTLIGREIRWANRTYSIDRQRRVSRIVVHDDAEKS